MDTSNAHPVTWIADIISGLAIAGTIVGFLPYIAAILGMIWYVIQICESNTVQVWWQTRKIRKKTRLMARLKAEEKAIAAQIEAISAITRDDD